MKQNQRGFSLISMLIVMAIILILASAMLPNAAKTLASIDQYNAAQLLLRISNAETSFSQSYGGYVATPTLAAQNFTLGPNACYPNLLTVQDGGNSITSSAPVSAGYTVVVTPAGAGTTLTATANCPAPPTVYHSYSIQATPKIGQGRGFFVSNASPITFCDGCTATASSAPFAVSALNAGGGGFSSGSQNNAGSQFSIGLWDSSTTYQLGNEAVVNGTNAAYNGYTGTQGLYIFVGASGATSGNLVLNPNGNGNGGPSDPINPNWVLVGNGTRAESAIGSPTLTGSYSVSNPPNGNCDIGAKFASGAQGTLGCYWGTNLFNSGQEQNVSNGIAVYHSLSISLGNYAPPTDIVVALQDNNTNQVLYCYIGAPSAASPLPSPGSASSCAFSTMSGGGTWNGQTATPSGLPLGGTTSHSGLVVNSGDQFDLLFLNMNFQIPYASMTVTWTLSQ